MTDKETKGFIFAITEITEFKLWYYSAIIGAGFIGGAMGMLGIFCFISNLNG